MRSVFGVLNVMTVMVWACWTDSVAAASPCGLAGFAEIDITPPVGIHLGGRGCKETKSDGVLDPLRAGVTVLRDAGNVTLVIVSFDLAGLPHWLGEQMREEIAGALDIRPEYVILNCSHTHSGPMMYREIMAGCGEATEVERAYMNRLKGKVIEMVTAAAGQLKPVAVYFHHGTCDVGINRRGRQADGRTVMAPNPEGPYEPGVWVMRLASPEGKTRAVLFSYACHPVIVYGYALSKISAEYPGVTRRELRSRLGQAVHVQFLQGAAGNVRPRCLADLNTRKFRPSKPDDLQAAGTELATAVMNALDRESKPSVLRLAATMDVVFLKRGTPPPRSFYEDMARTAKDYTLNAARYWLDEYDKGGPFVKGDYEPVGVIRLSADQWVAYLAGEPVAEWARLIRTWFGSRSVVVWGYSQQVFSYLPVDEILKEGGYEVRDSALYRVGNPAPFAPGLNEAIGGSIVRQIDRIEAGTR